MMQSPPASNASSAVMTLIVLVLAAVAIVRSSRKLHTALYIVGCMVTGLLVGAGVGMALHNPVFAGTFGALLMQVAGIVASIERTLRYKKGTIPEVRP